MAMKKRAISHKKVTTRKYSYRKQHYSKILFSRKGVRNIKKGTGGTGPRKKFNNREKAT